MNIYKKCCLVLLLMQLLTFNQLALASTDEAPSSNRQIYIFISSSMPPQSIQQWLQQAKQANAIVVMRGLIHNSFVETTRWLNQYQQSDMTAGIEIDPTLFQRFHITEAPSIVLVQNDNTQKVVGDVPLSEALKLAVQINKSN